MRKINLFLLSLATVIVVGCRDQERNSPANEEYSVAVEDEKSDTKDKVYVCTGGSAKRYHAVSDCKGLSNCRGDIEEMDKEEEEYMGRTPCRMCY